MKLLSSSSDIFQATFSLIPVPSHNLIAMTDRKPVKVPRFGSLVVLDVVFRCLSLC